MSNSRTPYHELAAKLGLSINAVHKRIKAMMDSGVIRAFTARASLSSLGAVSVWIFGRSEASRIGELHLTLKNNDSTYWVAHSGGGFVYVGGYLRSIADLDSYVAFVRSEGEIADPTVGIVPQQQRRYPNENLRDLDVQILASLHKDSRKPVSEVASEVRASSKTVHRRLERMIDKELVEFSMEWYPDKSNDFVALCHVELATRADRTTLMAAVRQAIPQNILLDIPFSNLPGLSVAFLWTNSMKQMEDLREIIGRIDGVRLLTLNVLQIGYIFDTWRDMPMLGAGTVRAPSF